MKFIVTRSSDFCEEDPKCPKAQKEIVLIRENLESKYVVEINSLEELSQLNEKLGCPLILSNLSSEKYPPKIEIYDSYRE